MSAGCRALAAVVLSLATLGSVACRGTAAAPSTAAASPVATHSAVIDGGAGATTPSTAPPMASAPSTSQPSPSECGDGVATAGESCDDGNTVGGDGCSSRCSAEALQIAAGSSRTCVVTSLGTLRCWGWNGHGALGLGDLEDRGDGPQEMGDSLPSVDLGAGRRVRSVSIGGLHTCAVLDDGSVRCWGGNNRGQLGLGDRRERGGQPGEMGDALPPVELGAGRTATAVVAGTNKTCAVLDNGSAKCWGRFQAGELGYEEPICIGDEPGEMGDRLQPVGFGPGSTVESLVLGENHVCALVADHTVRCLGAGAPRGYGRHPPAPGVAPPPVHFRKGWIARQLVAGAHHTCALFANGDAGCWGNSNLGQLGYEPSVDDCPYDAGKHDFVTTTCRAVPPSQRIALAGQATALSSWGNHTCALLTSGTVQCWGLNQFGQLGHRSSDHCRDFEIGEQPCQRIPGPPVVAAPAQVRLRAIAAGSSHTCELFEDTSVKCWGWNKHGELGYGDTELRDQPPAATVEY